MTVYKMRSAASIAAAAACGMALALHTLPAFSQAPDQPATDQSAPPPADSIGAPDAAPPSGDAAAPAAEPTEPAPDSGAAAAPSAEPPQDSGAAAPEAAPPADSGAAEVPPVQPETPAATAEPSAPAEGGASIAISASDIQIGAAVFGADGAKIGEVNAVKSDDTGKLQEILVTDGVPAGINAKVFEVTADKITSVSDGVKLSLSAEDAKKLPIIDNSNG
ncbi:MAG: PRC-barrel domain-containing protein [Hyphomicrobium sp.]